ncbi:MAG: hypothetical protein KA319_10770 [Ferruginibacter sp.]|nr:hypothetical protein [Ferruginibacter sp.]
MIKALLKLVFSLSILLNTALAQTNTKPKYNGETVYAGIEVGSKGVKLSVLGLGKNAKKTGNFSILKDTTVNTDFINFSKPTFTATLNGLYGLYKTAANDFNILPQNIFTVFSSGVKIMADKENKKEWLNLLADSFRLKVNEPKREVNAIDVLDEAKLSHIGIVPESKRYTTFLIDIGSGNTKGGYFSNGNTNTLKLFQLTWGTKSVTNEAEKRCDEDKSMANYYTQLNRVMAGPANGEIAYAVNESGAYNMSDYVAFSGGIAWSVATLLYPELNDNSVVPVTYDDVFRFNELIYRSPELFSTDMQSKLISDNNPDKAAIVNDVKRVNKVFDQKSLMAGSSLMLKIMRQFAGVYEKKQFYLVKNGQVGWISAYVDLQTKK